MSKKLINCKCSSNDDLGDEDWYNPVTMEAFLDVLSDEIDAEPSKLIPYTVEMDTELGELLDGVELD